MLTIYQLMKYFSSQWYSIAMNCGGRLRTTPEKSLMRRALFFFPNLYVYLKR